MSWKRKLHVGASKLHKWLALIIGVQLLIWFASGTIMSWLPIEQVRGEHLIDREQMVDLRQADEFVSMAALLTQVDKPVGSIDLRMIGGRSVAIVKTADSELAFDARTGQWLPAIDLSQAQAIARSAWIGPQPFPVSTGSLIASNSVEYRGALPAWRLDLRDAENTRVYVAATTGRITGVRTGTWRLYDFFWALHIMDWTDHEDFNTPWLLAFAIGGLALALAGTALLVLRWPIRRRKR